MILESIISIIGPFIFLKGLKYEEYNYTFSSDVTYSVNQVLCAFVWIKLYAVLRTILLSNQFTEPRAQWICTMYSTKADLLFSLRSLFKDKPNLTLVLAFVASSGTLAYMLWVFERPPTEISKQNYNDILDAVWNVVVTMTTVGYGDIWPKSYGGWVIGTIICLWGVLLVSLFVVTISQSLEFDAP